ncbi:hypothetical protein HN011_003722 [Eciton burchellii]|nr:hypothetical protein HN011_003722 [Eciton burchellii]
MCECSDECADDRKTREPRDIEFRTSEMATLGLSKVFILDKYFTELQKFWETEKKLQGIKLQKRQSLGRSL